MFESSVFDSKDIKEVVFDVQCLQVSSPEQKFIVFLIKIWALNLTRIKGRNNLLSVVVSNQAILSNETKLQIGLIIMILKWVLIFFITIYFTITQSYTYQIQQICATGRSCSNASPGNNAGWVLGETQFRYPMDRDYLLNRWDLI